MNTRAVADPQLAKCFIGVVRSYEDTDMNVHSKSSMTPSAVGSIYDISSPSGVSLVREY